KSVNAALTQIEKELKQAGLAQQKPATDALNQAADMAKAMIHEMRSEMSRYTWKSAIYLVLTILFVMAACVTAFTWFMNDGYSHIAEMQRMEAVWQKKAPLADISRCDGKPCVKVDTRTTYGDKENTWMIIKK
ncbi:mobilization protein MobX, partial [Escherichia coli]